ncbi:MAG TPA: S9 family peptidase [Planctomycetaceae bacterium]|nr:S9 family peptidase [Planctomycetaceae bacterium]
MRAALAAVSFVGLSALLGSANARADAPIKTPTVKTLTVQDVFNLQLPADPQISPDGRRIIYVRQFSDIMADKRHSNLWIINTDGTQHRPLTTGNFNDSSPRWSHDGTQIIYTSNRDGGGQIYRRWMDSGQTAKLTNLTAEPAGIAWSPDDRWISFTMFVPEKGPELIQMPAAPEGAKWAEPAKVIDRLIYRFNGAGYLKRGYTHLFVVPADGGTPRQISEGKFHHGGLAFQSSEAVWTPDGKYLLMSANRHPDFESDPINTEVYEFAVADGSVKALTNRKGPDNNPDISPDGKKIAYVGFDDRYQGYQVRQLYVMNRDGSDSRLLSGSFDNDVQSPHWAPDGKGIYFASSVHGNTGLYFIDLEGHLRQLVGDIGSSTSAYGGLPMFSVAKDGTFATTHTRPDVPGEIATGTKAAPGPKVLTNVNEGLLSGRKLGQVEEIWYESSKDHRKIQGWILKPPGFDPKKKYPLILEIHGGPFANYGDRFDLEKQLMAAKGYVVLYTNPRGSTSYGGEFGNLIHHAYPGDDFADLNSGVDAVLARGYIDKDELYVTGGSGGGVLTCWVIGHTTRFRAAVTVYPVINWYSFVLTSDIGGWIYKYWFPGLPWDNVAHYEKRSLLSVVKNVKTPTMVLTGELDYRTPMSDSEQYYQALKLLGVETVLVRVPDEPHGIQVRPSHHVAKILYILTWFDKHRKGK